MRCPNCNNEVENGAKFCGSCGTVMQAAPAENAAPKAKKPVSMPDLSKLPVKKIIVGVAAVLVVVLLFTLVGSLFSGGKESLFYVKEEEVFYNDYSKKAPYQVTSKLLADSYMSNYELSRYSYIFGVVLSEDEKTMLYVDRVDSGDDGVSLYYKKVKNVEDEGTKLDSDITRYSTNDKLTKVLYLKDDSLYMHDLKDKEKLASDVEGYYASADLKTIYFTDEDGDLYLLDGTEKEKVASEVENVEFSEDMKTVYYLTEEDSLYVKHQGKDKEKIASDVYNFYTDASGKGVYYYGSYEHDLIDFLENDLDDWDDDDMEDYFEDYKIWSYSTLYYFDGKESTTVVEAGEVMTSAYSEDKTVLVLKNYDLEAVGTIKMSDVKEAVDDGDYYWYGDGAEGLLEEAMEENMSVVISVDGVVSPLDAEAVTNCSVSGDGKVLYFLGELDEDDYTGDLYKAKISGTKVGEPEKIDSDVYYSYLNVSEKGDVIYFKDADDGEGEMYFNGESVASDVRLNYYSMNEDGKLYYLTDYSSKKEQGTLNVFNGKKSETISDDVKSWRVLEDGTVLFLYDYSTNSYTGELCQFKGKKAETIDEDVVAILNVTVGACTKYVYFY